MESHDTQKFSDALNALGVALGKDVTPEMLEVYWRLLEDIPITGVLSAIMAAGRTLKFFPKPSELRDLAAPFPVETQAALAWEAAWRAIFTVGWNHHVDFGPLVNAVIRNMGGWEVFCDITDAAKPFERKKFEDLFCRFSRMPTETLNGAILRSSMDIAEVRRVAIPGLPHQSSAKQLEAANGSGQLRAVIHQLADAKSP